MIARSVRALAAIVGMSSSAIASEPVLLHAAGSLRAPLTEIIKSFEADTGSTVQAKYGASGLLKEEIVAGAPAQVFASANLEHPKALAQAGRAGPVVLFARNRLCALVRPGLAVDAATLLDRMLDPDVKLGTSTPRADPSGDYAWEVFRKADAIEPGAFARLAQKALQLTGGASGKPPSAGRSIYSVLMSNGAADIFLTYCTNCIAARKEDPELQMVALPDALGVGADYGLTVMSDAPPNAYRFAMFVGSEAGQRILASHGFSVPGRP